MVELFLLLPQHPNRKTEPYLTPIRECDFFVVCGCVIFQQSILTEIIDIIDGEVDYIFRR